MRTYRNGQDLRADIKKGIIPSFVAIKVSPEILADMLGHRFVGPNGATISMEQVDIWYNVVEDLTLAAPLVVVQDADAG